MLGFIEEHIFSILLFLAVVLSYHLIDYLIDFLIDALEEERERMSLEDRKFLKDFGEKWDELERQMEESRKLRETIQSVLDSMDTSEDAK